VSAAEAPIGSASLPPAGAQRLGQRALTLGAANAFDFALQFLLPVLLVRYLDADAFGEYRLLWLVAGTVLAVATLAMPASLYYFLPRSDAQAKRLYVNQTLAFLVFAGLVCAWAVSAWNPWLPANLAALARHGVVVPAFILLWVIASLLDLLPAAEERVTWQAKATVGLSVLRAALLSLVAVLTRELAPVLLVLFAFVAFKAALLLVYVARIHGLRGPVLRWRAFVDQLRYAAPLGAAGALYGLRTQADQWVVAALFPLGMFASFSIAAVLGSLMHLCRQSVTYAFLPAMSRRQATGDVTGMLALNSRGNIMVGALVFPLFAFVFVFAEELVTLVYTATYLDAAAVMRVYIIGIVAFAVELSVITMLLRQAVFVMAVNAAALILAVALNWVAAVQIGLTGAAVGSVIVIYLDRIATLRRISLLTGVPIRRLQNWKTIALLGLCAAAAAVVAWGMVARFFPASGLLTRLLVGGATLTSAYIAIAASSSTCRVWFASLRRQQHVESAAAP
jgi:O-antigen/teichoic acid export membrane protein